MVYIFFYMDAPKMFYILCPSIQHAISLLSYYAGDLGYLCQILPYNPIPRSFDDFKNYISGVYSPVYCDITRLDILTFEFMYNVSLQITDLYE